MVYPWRTGKLLEEAKQMRQSLVCWCGLPRQRVSAPGQYRAGGSIQVMRRVPPGAFARLERHVWQHTCAILRRGSGDNTRPFSL
jgi:hypothetical protein